MTRRPFDTANKGIPFGSDGNVGWSLFGDDATLPAAVLVRDVLEANSAAMMDFCARHGVSLAPHGKTTMSPELFDLQIRHGAWAITAANVHQARVMKDSGVPRVLIANEVTAPGDIAWLASQVALGFDICCYVDSIEGARLLHEGMVRHAPDARLAVLLELGVAGGRTGARTVDAGLRVAHEVAGSASLRIAGVAGFEGILTATPEATAEQRVDAFLGDLVRLAEAVLDAGLADDTHEFVVSAGGSVFFDRVVAALQQVRSERPSRIVLRSGCYLSHDDGVIDEHSPLGNRPRVAGDVLHAALEVWAAVLSRPEPGRIIVGAGKRDLSTDSLFPVAKKWVRRGTREVSEVPGRPRAVKVDDQHAYIDIEPSWDIAVGDSVGLGISHPCTTFDKWRVIAVVDHAYDVVDVVTTRF